MASAIHAVAGMASGAGAGLAGAAPGARGADAAPFSDLITDAIGDVDRLQEQANTTISGLMTGTGVDVHQAAIAAEKASMAFELTLAVRNKAVQAYQQIMSMQF